MKKHDSLVGRIVLGNYIIKAPIGHGAMGTVFLGKHKVLGRQVAVKVLRNHLISEENERRRFHDEAEAIARLTHPNVVTILDFGTTSDGIPCIVTEFIAGETLLDILDTEGPLEPWRATGLIQQALSALIEAHAMGIIHRDIKADNIMVQRLQDGREQVKLVDFGVSLVEGRPDTDGGFIFGTPLYMSPEQCQGELLDDKADLYSLGVVFFELLTGEPLFNCEDPYDFLHAHIHTQPPRPSDIADQPIPGSLEQIIMKLLEKDKNNRFQSAQEVKQALHQWEVSRKATQVETMSSTWSGQSADDTSLDRSSIALEEIYEKISEAAGQKEKEDASPRALLIEKNQEVGQTLAKNLTRMGLDVMTVPTPRAAEVLLASDRSYDLYLLACKLKDDNEDRCNALITDILTHDPLAEILVISGFSDVQKISEQHGWEVSDFLIRPFRSFQAFTGRIRAALKRREANIAHSNLMRETMNVLGEKKDTDPLSREIYNILGAFSRGPATLAAWISTPACIALKNRKHNIISADSTSSLNRILARRGLHAVLLESSVLDESLLETTAGVISKRPDLEVILIGNRDELRDMLDAVELGATDFIVKPSEGLDVLVQKTEQAVARRKRRLKIRKLAKTLESMAATSKTAPLEEKLRLVRKVLSETLVIEAEPAEQLDSPISGLNGNPEAVVAEPDRLIRNLVTTSLKVLGWNCIPAATMKDAIQKIRDHEADLFVLAEEGEAWGSTTLLKEAVRLHKRTPICIISPSKTNETGLDVPEDLYIGALRKPLEGLKAIHQMVKKSLSRRRELLLFDTEEQESKRRTNVQNKAMRILLVEDDDEISNKLEAILRNERFPVLRTKSMEKAVHKLARYEVDAVIVKLDLLVEATENILQKAKSIDPRLPMLAYSQKSHREQALTAIACGAGAFLSNPMENPEHFLSRLREHRKTTSNHPKGK